MRRARVAPLAARVAPLAAWVALLAARVPALARAEKPARLKIVAEPASLLLGSDRSATLTVTLDGAPAVDVRFVTTLGRVDGAAFHPGDRRAPAIALVAARAGSHVGAVVLPLVGQGSIPTRTSPGASVTVEIAGRRFGPQLADARGDASIPVEVPPHAQSASVHAVDRRGLATHREIRLPGSEFPLGLVVAPERLAAGERATATVFAATPTGAWRNPSAAPPSVRAADPAMRVGSPRAVAPGRWDVPLEAASGTAPVTVTIEASLDGTALAPAIVTVEGATPTPPPVVVPAPPPPRRGLGARTGIAASPDGLASPLVEVDLDWPVRIRRTLLHVAFGLGAARGRRDGATLTQLYGHVGARLRVALGHRVALDLGAGAGFAWVSADVDGRAAIDSAPLVYAALALVVRDGPGELVIDLRYVDARFDPFTTDVSGSALGVVTTLGYRASF